MTIREPLSLFGLLAFLLHLTACNEAQQMPARSNAALIDVQNDAPLWKTGEQWRVDSIPLLTVGTLDGPPETVFANISAPAITPSGRLVLGEDRDKIVRIFDKDGTFLKAIGREGSGPGEFERAHLSMYALNEDTIAVFEQKTPGRIHYFSIERGFISAIRLNREYKQSANRFLIWRSRMTPGGRSVVFLGESEDGNAKYEPKLVRDSAQVVWTDSAMRVIHDFGSLPSREHFLIPHSGNYGASQRSSPYIDFSPPFAGGLAYGSDPSGRRLCVGLTRAPILECVDRDGSGVRIHWKADPVPITDAEERRWRAYNDSSFRIDEPQMQPSVRGSIAELQFEMTKPYFGAVRVDADLNVWVEMPDKRARGSTSHQVFSVFRNDGKYLGDVPIAATVRIELIGRDRVVGRGQDSSGAPVVKVFGVRKGSGGH